MQFERHLRNQVVDDLTRQMVLVAGPRQAGKTTLALSLPGDGADPSGSGP